MKKLPIDFSLARVSPVIRQLTRTVEARAQVLGLPLYIVGGSVRDWFLGLETKDLDFAVEGKTEALAQDCARLLRGRIERFDRFGTFRLQAPGRLRVDFATTRREKYPAPAGLPVVSSPVPITEDLRRRDFAVNAMALKLGPGRSWELVDPFGGVTDLRAKVLRLLHDESLRDDPTRVFRAARYLARFGFKPAPGFAALAREALRAGYPALLSRHRVANEFLRILSEKDPSGALKELKALRYLSLIGPELLELSGWPFWGDGPAEERLGALLLSMDARRARAFLSSLPVEHGLSVELRRALDIAEARMSPREPLPGFVLRLLKSRFPDAPSGALRPLRVRGDDLKALGLPPGRRYRELLDEAAVLQWRGELPTRARALEWLGARLAR